MAFRLISMGGIPLRIRWSFIFLLLFAFLLGSGISSVLFVLMIFAGVVLHELGHAWVARRLNVPIAAIELHFFGGAALMGRMPERPRDEIWIAVAGPAVSFALAGLSALAAYAGDWVLLRHFAYVNLVLGGFNLLPALPMDGGRILRAALAIRMGRLPATVVAVRAAKIFAVAMGLIGFFSGHFFLAAPAIMLWMMAKQELLAARAAEMREYWLTVARSEL